MDPHAEFLMNSVDPSADWREDYNSGIGLEKWKFSTRPTRLWFMDELDFSIFGQYEIGC